MRRFSSEGNLLDIDFFPWRKVALKNSDNEKNRNSGTYTFNMEDKDVHKSSSALNPVMQEPTASAMGKKQLTKEHSVSAENMSELGKQNKNLLEVCDLSESCRAYSDSQLAPPPQGSSESGDVPPTTPTSSFNPFFYPSQQEHHHKPKLSTARLHLRMLFGQSPHSSSNNLFSAEHKDLVKERRSRLLFMRQWSQVGHNRKRKISREELELWAQSLNSLLDSPTGVSVFGAFLRSEFSEENLQFYLACEQYRHSSSNFSLQRRAKDICATYIQPGSPREVNLDSKTRDLTIQLLQAPSHTSLTHAQRRIYSLLDTDCYPRFLQSTIYLSLLREDD